MKNFVKLIIISSLFAFSFTAEATKKTKKKAPEIKRIQTSLVVDTSNGKILHQQNIHDKVYPASLTKLMTLYVTFDEIKKGTLKLEDELLVSKEAVKIPPGNLGVKPGETLTAKDAIIAVIIKSANDCSNVLAEHIAGSQEKFAHMMNQKALDLGMKNSHFTNAHGWHHPHQKTTATDLARLALAVKEDFPQYYHYFANDSFVYKGRLVKGHNRVTREYAGAEGMKTGFTNPAGFNLVTTASKNGKNLLAVVTGSPSHRTRDNKMMALLDEHFGIESTNSVTLAKEIPKKDKVNAPTKTPLEKNILAKNNVKNNPSNDVFEANYTDQKPKAKTIAKASKKQKVIAASNKAKKYALSHKKSKKNSKKIKAKTSARI